MDELPTQKSSDRKKIVFLAGLPRTGSTLLNAVLGQDHRVHVGPTSPLALLLGYSKDMAQKHLQAPLARAGRTEFLAEWYDLTAQAFYKEQSQTVIIDKNRIWCGDMDDVVTAISDDPRMVVLLRDVVNIGRSIVAANVQRKDVLPEYDLLSDFGYFLNSIRCVAHALQNASPRHLFVRYEDMVIKPREVVSRIASFLGLPKYDYALSNIKNQTPDIEVDGHAEDFHHVRPKIATRKVEVTLTDRTLARLNELNEALWADYGQARSMQPSAFLTIGEE